MSSNIGKPSVLRHPGYRDLWVGQLISQFGDVLHFLVFLWWAGEVGGPAGVGIVGSCSVGAYLLLSMYAGTVADRIDRRKILLYSDIVCAAVVGILTVVAFLEPRPPLWVLCVFTILLKSAFVFQRPARSAAVPRLVPEERLLEANSLNTTIQMAMPVAGNALGAVVLGAIFVVSKSLGYVFTFGLNAVTFIGSAFFMAKLPPIEPERDKPPKNAWHEAKEGVKFIWTHPVLRTAALIFFGFELFVSPFMTGYVVAAGSTLKTGFSFLGMHFKGPALISLLETGFFLGFVIGSYLVYRNPVRRVGVTFSIAIFLSALAMVPMGVVTSVPLFYLLNTLCGLVMPAGIIPLETFMQAETPDEFRGRVNAAIGTMAGSAAPIGMLGAGFVISGIGLGWTFAIMGLGLGFCSLAGLLSPSFRASRLSGDEPRAPTDEQPVPGVLETA